MASRPRPPSPLACLLFATLLAGCGRAVSTGAEPGSAPASTLESDKSDARDQAAPETLEQAEAELEQARLALAQVGGGLSAPAGAPVAAAPAPAPPPSPATRSASAEKEKKRAAADEAPSFPNAVRDTSRAEGAAVQAESAEDAASRDDNRCETTCKAYASLLRAKSAVCRLDAPGGARCARAEGIVRDATPQIQSCHCSP